MNCSNRPRASTESRLLPGAGEEEEAEEEATTGAEAEEEGTGEKLCDKRMRYSKCETGSDETVLGGTGPHSEQVREGQQGGKLQEPAG